MLTTGQVHSVSNTNLNMRSNFTTSNEQTPIKQNTTIYEYVDKCMQENISSMLYDTRSLYIGLMSKQSSKQKGMEACLELIGRGKKQKIMFGFPQQTHTIYGGYVQTSLIGYLIKCLCSLEENESCIDDSGKYQLTSKISDLVLTCTHISEQDLRLLPKDLLEKRNSYLSNLKQIVCDSIESDKKDGVIVERDNAFYCVQCPEESVVTPAKFMNSPEFKDLEYGALKIGEGDDIIRIRTGNTTI